MLHVLQPVLRNPWRISSCCSGVVPSPPFADLAKAWSRPKSPRAVNCFWGGLLGCAELLYEFISGSDDGMSPRDAGRGLSPKRLHYAVCSV